MKIYLEWQAFHERCHLVIVNRGKRPITIKRVIVTNPEDGWQGFTVLDEQYQKKLPLKLSFGDEATFILRDEVAGGVWNQQYDLFVLDAEGNRYKPTLKREYSPRYGNTEGFSKIR